MAVDNSLKSGVDLRNLAPQWGIGYPIIQALFNDFGYSCVVTSANDSTHGVGSLHPSGYALDFRTRHVPVLDKAPITQAIAKALGPQWDVILESVGQDNEHLHIEFDAPEDKVSTEV